MMPVLQCLHGLGPHIAEDRPGGSNDIAEQPLGGVGHFSAAQKGIGLEIGQTLRIWL